MGTPRHEASTRVALPWLVFAERTWAALGFAFPGVALPNVPYYGHLIHGPMGRHDDDDLPKPEAYGIISAQLNRRSPTSSRRTVSNTLTLPHSAPCCIDLCAPGPGHLSSQIRFSRFPQHSQPLNIFLRIPPRPILSQPTNKKKSLGPQDRIRVRGRGAYVPQCAF